MNILLTGLPSNNPLGYLACLGVLIILDKYNKGTISWVHRGSKSIAQVDCFESEEELLDFLLNALKNNAEPLYSLCLPFAEKGKITKFSPSCYAEIGSVLKDQKDFRALELLVALATDTIITEDKGKLFCKSSSLYMAKGDSWQCLLNTVNAINLTRERLRVSLFGPWDYEDFYGTSNWDYSDLQDFALIAKTDVKTKPSKKLKIEKLEPKARSMAGAVALAWEGLSLFPVFPQQNKAIYTVGFSNDQSLFHMPIWEGQLSKDCVRTILSNPDLYVEDSQIWSRGVVRIFRARRKPHNKSVKFKLASALVAP
jgi:hypothetical protein